MKKIILKLERQEVPRLKALLEDRMDSMPCEVCRADIRSIYNRLMTAAFTANPARREDGE